MAYRAEDVSLPRTAGAIDARPVPEVLDLDAALRLADRHNPELAALAARARGAGLDYPAVFVRAEADFQDEDYAAAVDPVAVAGAGPRGRARDVAAAERLRILAEGRRRRFEIACDIARCFAVEAALAEMPDAELPVDAAAFERAGLAAPVDTERVRAAQSALAAETAARAAAQDENLARLRRLLGIGPDAPLRLRAETGDHARAAPDLLRHARLAAAVARYRVADAELRLAVARQYPSLEIGGKFTFDGGAGGLVAVRLPVGASRAARAAEARREAARLDLETALLAQREARDTAAAALRAAEKHAVAAEHRSAAARRVLDVALARLEVEPDVFAGVAKAAEDAVAATGADRTARLAFVSARFAWKRAAGVAPRGGEERS